MEGEELPAQDPNLDVEELIHLQSLATRPKVKEIIAANISKLKLESAAHAQRGNGDGNDRLKDSTASSSTKPRIAPIPSTYYKPLTTYAWDQSDNFVKIYVTMKGVQKLPKESVTSTYSGKSFKVLVENLDGQNFSCHVAFLWGKIIPEKCYHKVKSDMVLVMMKKEEDKKTWPYVTETEGKTAAAKPKPKMDEQQDPGAGLMDLMKKMYDEGDDEMKRTIAKSWSESRDKSGRGPMDL